MKDETCIFQRSYSEITEDEKDPHIQTHYQLFKCTIIEEGGKCPFPARICEYKIDNEDPTIDGNGMKFKDGSVLERMSELLEEP